ncbi:hypothetical protein DFH08DRAFT_1041050 [Mycena albidolilacea]|uniref:Uncharacterized protein n=1 Tax=Mycena albidolilacea TaxID=1033008 RepID=A0AAD6ZB08_9AGAR|nr:hypothetical protein DFH08DRAFT_1041050 [Mycena albidolilacea]
MFWVCGSRKEGGTCPTFKALLLTKLNFNSDSFFVIEGENGVGRRGWRHDGNLGSHVLWRSVNNLRHWGYRRGVAGEHGNRNIVHCSGLEWMASAAAAARSKDTGRPVKGDKPAWRLQDEIEVADGAPEANRCEKHDLREERARWEMVREEEKAININQVSPVIADAHGPSVVISSLPRQIIGPVILVDLAMWRHMDQIRQIRQLLPALASSSQTDSVFLMSVIISEYGKPFRM